MIEIIYQKSFVNRNFTPFLAWIKLNVGFMITKFSVPTKLTKNTLLRKGMKA